MNLTRRILEGIHEVELQVTPEFRKPSLEPEVWQRTPVGTDAANHTRYRVVYRWPDATIATGLELFKLVAHVDVGYELNVWAPGSTIKPGEWAAKMGSISEVHEYPGGIYVYVQSEQDPIFREIDAAVDTHVLNAYVIIDQYDVGQEQVVDHFKGYEGKPASEFQATAEPEQAAPANVFLSSPMKRAVDERDWIAVNHIDEAVTESNPVMILIKSLPIFASEEEKKRIVAGKFEELRLKVFWASGIEVWKVWPEVYQDPEDFGVHLDALIARLDEVAHGEEEV